MNNLNLKLVSEKDDIRSQIPQKFRDRFDSTVKQDGVHIVGFKEIKPSSISIDQTTHQSRVQTYDNDHAKKIKNTVEEIGWPEDMPPLCIKHDAMTSKDVLVSGHHRHWAATECELDLVPCFVMDFGPRVDGLDAEEEFKQAENSHKPALPHNQHDALKYLQTSKHKDVFKNELLIKDKEKQNNAVRIKANKLLQDHYPSYSPQKRGSIVKDFIKGYSPALIKRWSNSEVVEWFVNNNHLEDLNIYVYSNNKIDIVTQAKTIVTYPVGSITEKLRETFNQLREDGVKEPTLQKKIKSLTIRVGVYIEKAKDYEELNRKRKKVLEDVAKMNSDNLVSPLVYSEIYFVYQSLQAPNKEPEQPIMYQ